MSNKTKLYQLAARIAVKYGGRVNSIYTERRISEFWEGDNKPSPTYLMNTALIPNVKWFIRNRVKTKDAIWNSHFLHGLATAGIVRWNERSFPTLEWYGNGELIKILQRSPFGGILNKTSVRRAWKCVPALYLDYDMDSISFMAGVMATGENVKIDGESYIKYKRRQHKYFNKWGIPVEQERKKHFFISPIWPALFSIYMPEEQKKRFIVKDAFKGRTYAPVLWHMYLKKSIVSDGIPYLMSKRQVYYDHACEEGFKRKMEMLRIELNLIALDKRIKKAVRRWAKTV